MEEKAYAKINIGLRVGKRRADGYHEIATYMALTDLHDSIEGEIETSDEFSCVIEGNDGYIGGGTDLMEKAARAFSSLSGITFSIHLKIEKRIPAGAGLGGGSSDAAAVLRMLSSHFNTPRSVMREAAEMTGSDVPFFASGLRCAYATGRGEKLREASIPEGLSVMIIVPEYRVSTKNAYEALDEKDRADAVLPPLPFTGVPDKASFPNDFESVYTGPVPSFRASGPSYVSLSGSGSSWFALYSSDDSFEFEKSEYCAIYSSSFIISG